MKVRLTFLEPVLGTWPSNENIARDFIASKAPDASTIKDEIAALGNAMQWLSLAALSNGIA